MALRSCPQGKKTKKQRQAPGLPGQGLDAGPPLRVPPVVTGDHTMGGSKNKTSRHGLTLSSS